MGFAVEFMNILFRQGHWKEVQTLDHRATSEGRSGYS